MICDECGQREATVTLTVVQGEERTLRHLCPECMQRLGNARNMLSAIFAAAVANVAALAQQRQQEEQEETEEIPDKTCACCGLTYAAFKKSGKLGCPGCYEAFREELRPMLQQLHGRAQHAGRQPLRTQQAQQGRSRQEELRREMAEAVLREDFEQAAALRDQLRSLEQGVNG